MLRTDALGASWFLRMTRYLVFSFYSRKFYGTPQHWETRAEVQVHLQLKAFMLETQGDWGPDDFSQYL